MEAFASTRSPAWSRKMPRNVAAAVVAASLVAHAAVLAVVHVHASPPTAVAPSPPPAAAGLVDQYIDIDCYFDLALVTGARAVFCATPVAGGTDACMGRLAARTALEAVACEPVAPPDDMEVALLEPVEPDALPMDLQLARLTDEKHEEAVKPEEDPAARGQVVDLARPAVEVRPDDAAYVSEYDTKVERQQVHHGAVDGPAGGPGAALTATPPPAAPPAETRSHGGVLAMRGVGHGTQNGAPEVAERGTADGNPVVSEDGQGARRGSERGGDREGQAGGDGETGDGGQADDKPDLRPSEELLARAAGGGSDDYLPDVDEGAETLLNSKRWRYASFFNRVKRQVAQEWRPESAYRLRDPSGNVYGTKNRLTVLQVSLKPDGSVSNILISKPCGVDFLDDEAQRAFEVAQPFPNPPGGLVDPGTGLITFRFGFMFEISDGGHWRVFRYRN